MTRYCNSCLSLRLRITQERREQRFDGIGITDSALCLVDGAQSGREKSLIRFSMLTQEKRLNATEFRERFRHMSNRKRIVGEVSDRALERDGFVKKYTVL